MLDLYDHRFRDLASPLVQAVSDFYIDVQNAASMLFRLELRGIDVDGRWVELADKAEARIGDCLSAFTLPHWMMALAADGRWLAADRLLDAIDAAAAAAPEDHAAVLRDAALPVCRAVLAHRRGDYPGAVTAMRSATVSRCRAAGGSRGRCPPPPGSRLAPPSGIVGAPPRLRRRSAAAPELTRPEPSGATGRASGAMRHDRILLKFLGRCYHARPAD